MSNELPTAFVSHRVPGRVRVRIPTMQNQEDYFARVRDRLATIPGMVRLTTNTRTASVLIEFSGDQLEGLSDLGQKLELFELGSRPHPHSLSEFLYKLTGEPDHFVKRVTDGRLDFAGITAIALTGFGITQVIRGHALPAGWTLLWNAANLVRDVGKVGHDTGE